mmetsp:Transcript_29754/g.91595  ORF Transcript_29754/g.91595 Transcript_29754/m.91595 type:complete len:305 (-) Transcript_29754:97-1011(-)
MTVLASQGPCEHGSVKKPEAKADAAAQHTPIQVEKGQVLPGSAEELRAMANEAVGSGDVAKAAHLYTMAIDLLAKGMRRDQDGAAAEADLRALNRSSGGQLAKLLSNRSMVYLRQQDVEAAIEDAETCTRADPEFEKGHMRLVAALEAAGAPLSRQLQAVEAGLVSCPGSEMLVTRKWRLKKALAAQPAPEQGEGGQPEQGPSIAETQHLADDPSDPRHIMAAADLGSVLAVGSHGLEKDVQKAERYLRVGSRGGDVGAQRNLGLLLLELRRPAEAAEELRAAAAAGDEGDEERQEGEAAGHRA